MTRRWTTPLDPTTSYLQTAPAAANATIFGQRMLHLLLRGYDPTKILFVAPSKSILALVRDRVTTRARAWANLDDAALDAELSAIGAKPNPKDRLAARQIGD